MCRSTRHEPFVRLTHNIVITAFLIFTVVNVYATLAFGIALVAWRLTP